MRTILSAILVLAIAACASTQQQSNTQPANPEEIFSTVAATVETAPICTHEGCEFGPWSYGSKIYLFPSGGSNDMSLGYPGDYLDDEIRDIFTKANTWLYKGGRVSWRFVDRTDLPALKALCASHPEAQQHGGCQCAWTMEDAGECGRVVGGNLVFTLRPMDTESRQKGLSDCNGSSLSPGVNAMVTDSMCGLVLVADVPRPRR